MVSGKENRDLALKKHVGSIHCSNTLSLLQRKISNVLLFHAYDQLLEKDEHEISIKYLCRMIGYSSHDYDTLKKSLRALISTVLEWNLLGDLKDPEGSWNASSILASVGIKGGLCAYSYSNRLKKLLYMPEIYGRINIAIQSRFKSSYGLALYENCIRYQNLAYTRWVTLSTFRKLMGVPENKYNVFRDFKRRVLDKSIEEVNLYSEIYVEPELVREGREICRIRFKIDMNGLNKPLPEIDSQVCTQLEHRVNASTAPEYHSKNLLKRLIEEFSLSQPQAKRILSEYEMDYLLEKMKAIKQSVTYKQGKVNSLSAYLMSALRDDYKLIPSRETGNKRQSVCSLKSSSDFLKKEYDSYVRQIADDYFNSLSLAEQDTLLAKFKNFLSQEKNTFVLEKFFDKGLKNKIVNSVFRTFLKEQLQPLLLNFQTFDEFKNQKINLTQLNTQSV